MLSEQVFCYRTIFKTRHQITPLLPESMHVFDRTKEQERDVPSPPHSFACARYFAVDLSTRIDGAYGMALLCQVETSMAEMLFRAPGRLEWGDCRSAAP